LLRFARNDLKEYRISKLLLGWEVQGGEVVVELASGFVISSGGVDLVVEVAEVVGFFIAGYLGLPFFVSFVHFVLFRG